MYYFNESLFCSLPTLLEMSAHSVAQAIGVTDTTLRRWRRSGDLPIVNLLNLCNTLKIQIGHFICTQESTKVHVGRRHYIERSDSFTRIRFLNKEFGEEVTTIQGRQVLDFCSLVGISATTFYGNFRNCNTIGPNITIQKWLRMCNKTKTYPLDFFTSNSVDVPVLDGYMGRKEGSLQALSARNIDVMSYNARLVRELDKERATVAELKQEVERLRQALGRKSRELAAALGELDEQGMKVAEDFSDSL